MQADYILEFCSVLRSQIQNITERKEQQTFAFLSQLNYSLSLLNISVFTWLKYMFFVLHLCMNLLQITVFY